MAFHKMEDFQVGDRVVRQAADKVEGPWRGLTGTIVEILDSCVVVHWDQPFPGGYNCNGKTPDNQGWGTDIGTIELYKDVAEDISISSSDILDVL